MRWWLNGLPAETLPLADRGLAYGDGLFSTIAVNAGVPVLLEAHIARLQQGCRRLGLAEVDWSSVVTQVQNLIAAQTGPAVIKLILTRGTGGRGYSSRGADRPNLIVGLGEWPHQYRQWRRCGIALGISSVRLGLNPLTAGMKHLNRLEQVLIRRDLDAGGWPDGAVCDIEGKVVETCVANLFWLKEGILYTPSLELAGVEGVMRRQVMQLAGQLGWRCQIGRYPLQALQAADEVFISNALMGVVPVIALDNHHHYPVQVVRTLQQQLGIDA